jgi:hypothetical protein
MVLDHEHEHTSRWATLVSIAGKIGCTAQTLHRWVGRSERDSGGKPGLTTEMAAKFKTLERENRELRQANEWVDWFNNRRLLEPTGNIPLAEAEERYYAMTEQPAMAA